MNVNKDILLVVDYHAENLEVRIFDGASGEERTENCKTTRANVLRLVEEAAQVVAAGGTVRWIMESTTGWARVKDLLGERAEFILANVLQMPLPPKWRRRQTDKIDTGRMLREAINGSLPRSFQPSAWWRQVRRLVDGREDLVRRQTAIKNWISSLLHHETWHDRSGLWSEKGMQRLARMDWPASDRLVLDVKLEELGQIDGWIQQVEQQMQAVYDPWPEAQWADEKRGKKIARIVIARMFLRSLYKMLREKVRFNQAPAA